MKKIINALLPKGSKRRDIVKRLVRRPPVTLRSSSITYSEWMKNCEPKLFCDTVRNLDGVKRKPLISILVPCFNTPDKYLQPLIASVFSQKYENWQLCIADGSTDEDRSRAIQEISGKDKRIAYKKIKTNKGIVGNTNEALQLARGEFIAFMDHDDMLSPYALAEIVIMIDKYPEADLIYSDEDKLTDDGTRRIIPFFKPDWSPDMLLGVNYITHFVVARAGIVHEIGGLRDGFDGAQDYDFLLRFTEKTRHIYHIPKILYHWRQADGSTAGSVGEKNYADDAGRRALKDAVARRGIKANVIEITDRPTNYRLQYVLPEKEPSVSIIIPFKDKVELLEACVPSILTSEYKNFEIILISNNSTEPETYRYLDSLKNEPKCRIERWDHPFNYSAINNYGASLSKADFLIFLNNDTKVITPGWIHELVGVASQKGIGAVGPLLLYPNEMIQHAGVVLGIRTMAGHPFRMRTPEAWTDFGLALWPRNYVAVTGACLAIARDTFLEAGGFDEGLRVGGNDVALCITLHEKGLRNIYWPFAQLYHFENVSVGDYNSNVPIEDYNRSLIYYNQYLKNGDPYFNKNLDLMNEYIGIGGGNE